MLDIMEYRGPDGRGEWHDEIVALGQCMFHTTPEAREARLPLASADGDQVLVMDGRIDNWEELRDRVTATGVTLRTRADEELVLTAYGLWGEDCVQHLDGDFAAVKHVGYIMSATNSSLSRRAYQSPGLQCFGRISVLTLGNGSLCADGNSGSQGNQSCVNSQ